MRLTWHDYEEVFDESVHDDTYGMLPGFSILSSPGFSILSSPFKIEKLRFENTL
jgi:hypothetical protein